MPLAASILWQPIDAAPGQDAELPVFISQRALTAIHDHCAAGHETCFGLLTGRLVRTADTGASYLVVESTIRLPGGTGDDAKAALLEGWGLAHVVPDAAGPLARPVRQRGRREGRRGGVVPHSRRPRRTLGCVHCRRRTGGRWFAQALLGGGITRAARPRPAHARGGCGDARGATGPRRRHPGPCDRRVRPAGPAVRQPADAMSRAGARAGPRRGALDGLQRRAEDQRRGARLRRYRPGPSPLCRCRWGRAAVRALGLPPTVTRAVALLALLVMGVPRRGTTQGS